MRWSTTSEAKASALPKDERCRRLPERMISPDRLSIEPLPVVGGSHDPLLEWSLRESGCGLTTLPEGSAAGLQRFVDGKLVAAAIHLHSFDDDSDENIAVMRNERSLHDAVLVGFARREQGIVVASGNPLGFKSIGDLRAERVRVAVRPAGAGAQLLLESLLMRAGLDVAKLNIVAPLCPTGPDIARAVQTGRADCGLASRSVANAAGLDFVSLAWESFDLVVRQRDYFRQPLQTFFAFLRTPMMQRHAADSGGYDITMAGEIRYAP
jgi:molybdate-binding protein